MYTIRNILILDSDGNRIAAKYYTDDYPTVKEQHAFEKNLFTKTHRINGMKPLSFISFILVLSLLIRLPLFFKFI